jgi:hypothetical protein
MTETAAAPNDEELLTELRRAIGRSPERPSAIEIGIALSIALGRRRTPVSCGGCSEPLAFEGIPARTNPQLSVPFRLVFEGSAGS